MKKNKMMRLASSLLVAVLLTSSVISGTFAKYVTADEATDTARVAKWGVTVTGETAATNDMFVKQYNETGSVTVDASEDVVAPGTSGLLTGFEVTGSPEVDVIVDYDDVELTLTGWKFTADWDGDPSTAETEEEYCPLVFTVSTDAGTNSYSIDGSTITTTAELELAVENAVKGAKAYYEANTDLSTVDNDLTVSWSWAYSTSTANDVKDTVLGDKAASGASPTVTFFATCKVTQVD